MISHHRHLLVLETFFWHDYSTEVIRLGVHAAAETETESSGVSKLNLVLNNLFHHSPTFTYY